MFTKPFYGLTIKQLALVKLVTDLGERSLYTKDYGGLIFVDSTCLCWNSSSPLYHPFEPDDLRKVLQIPIEAISRGLKPNWQL